MWYVCVSECCADFGILHHQSCGVLHHQDCGVLHHQGSGVLNHQGCGVLHHRDYGVLYHQDCSVLHQLCQLQLRTTVGVRFPVGVIVHVLCISSCLVPAYMQYHYRGDNAD